MGERDGTKEPWVPGERAMKALLLVFLVVVGAQFFAIAAGERDYRELVYFGLPDDVR